MLYINILLYTLIQYLMYILMLALVMLYSLIKFIFVEHC